MVFVLAAQIVFGSALSYLVYNFYFHPLSKLPGPLTARLGLPWFRLYATATGSYAWRLQSLHERYGSIVRIGPNFVSTIEPASVHKIYAHGSSFHKTPLYVSFTAVPKAPSIFADIDAESHAARRRSVAQVYAMKQLVDLEPFVDPVIERVFNVLDKKLEMARSNEANVCMNELLTFFAGDAIGELSFGESFSLLEAGDPSLILTATRNLQRLGSISGSLPSIATIMKPILWRLAFNLSPAVIGRETLQRVEARYAAIANGTFYDESGIPRRKDMLTGFVEAKNSQTKKVFTKQEVMSIATTVFSAGSDTTAGATVAFFYFLLKHPEVYAKVMKELDHARDSGIISSLPVSFAQGMKMEYLQACMKEALRLMPSIGMELARFVPKEGILVEGKYFLPPGTEVGASPFTFHRATAAYGDDAGSFRPERWIGISGEEKTRLEKNYLAFGAGARVCLGRNISIMEMTKLLPSILLKYTFSPLPREPGRSPHTRPVGRGLDGIESADEALWLDSNWLVVASDFWAKVAAR